jgi:tetratricopeptide (TPR) repeat protein
VIRRLLVQILAIAGIGFALQSCRMLWFAIPVGADPLMTSPGSIDIAQPQITIAYRLATVAVLAAIILLWWFGKTGTLGLVAASLWLAALLAYPYAVMVWDPSVSGDAAWLEAQHRDLVWSGGDLNMSIGTRAVGSLDDVLLTQTPRDVNPIDMSEWQPSELTLARLPDLVDRLGYSNKFFEFIRLGWIFALAGSIFLMIAISSPEGHLDMRRAIWTAGIFGGTMVVLVALGWAWSFLAAADLAAAARHTSRGQYQAALDSLQQARRRLPAIGEDTFFVAQIGLLADALGRPTPAARLYRANLDEQAGKYHQADVIYERLAFDPNVSPAVRREACRAMLRSAIDSLTAARADAALSLLEKVLAVEPCNLKANYALQLTCLRSGHYRRVSSLAQRMEAIYGYFQFPSKLAAISAGYQNSLVANAALGDTQAAVGDVRKVVNP